MGQAQAHGPGAAGRSSECEGRRKRRASPPFVLFDALPKDLLVHSLRYLPSHDHCKLARTSHLFADSSRSARSLYKGLRINSLAPPSANSHSQHRRRRGSSLAALTRRTLGSVFGGGTASTSASTSTANSGGGSTTSAPNSVSLPFLRLFRRERSGVSRPRPRGPHGGVTRAAIRALASGAFENLKMLSFPHNFDVHAYDLSYREIASIFDGCQRLKLVSSLPGGVLSFVARPLPALREVSIIGGTPSDLLSLFCHAPELTWLSFSPILSSACESLLGEVPVSLPKLKTLELISIRLTRHRLLGDLQKLEHLEMLSLQQVGIDDMDMVALSERGHPSLKVLVVLGNRWVTYDGLKFASQHLEKLKVLDVRDSLSDA